MGRSLGPRTETAEQAKVILFLITLLLPRRIARITKHLKERTKAMTTFPPSYQGDDPNTVKEREKLTNLKVGKDREPAAHESAAVLRMFRAGWTSEQMQRLFAVSAHGLMHQVRMALEDETKADPRPIYDSKVARGTK